MTEHYDLDAVATAAAKKAIRDTFRLLGVDVDAQGDVNAFRADLVHARRLRKIYEQSTNVALRVVVTSIAAAALYGFWDTLKNWLGK